MYYMIETNEFGQILLEGKTEGYIVKVKSKKRNGKTRLFAIKQEWSKNVGIWKKYEYDENVVRYIDYSLEEDCADKNRFDWSCMEIKRERIKN